MNELIFSCGCGDTDKFARDAFKLLFPGSTVPPIVHKIGRGNDRFHQVANALLKGQHEFAYYFIKDTDVLEAWDLLKGVRVL